MKETLTNLLRLPSVAIALIAFVGVLAFVIILSQAYKYKFNQDHTIEVTGMAKKDFESDLVQWSASFEKSGENLASLSNELTKNKDIIKQFLIAKSINEKDIIFESVNVSKNYTNVELPNGGYKSVFQGYNLNQTVSISSKDLNAVETVAREVSSLIGQGIELNSNQPNFYFSKLESLKLELIAQATQNARKRAEIIAEESNAGLGGLKQARLGVFQITGLNSSDDDFTYGGVFDTKSRSKTANITVKLTFKIK
ncbi:MAG: SIMPL domain-containing protein [Chitinophagales bacterium]|jgi:hypothetical protein|nr:SIMPL domain-containing protein [Chitinophagales bacterium]